MINKAYDVNVDNIQFYPEGFTLQWYGAIGFGEITVKKTETGDLSIDAEHMTPEFVKAVLNKMVDKAILA